MVSVDDQLQGIKMRLRTSMNKFQGPPEEHPAIAIARAFERPVVCYLNRWVSEGPQSTRLRLVC